VARAGEAVIRGVIEGFYGPPWTHEERLDLIRFCGAEGLTTWVHAPKDDPYHRACWRDPYPDDELARIGELVHAGGAYGVEVVYAIAPGLSICYSRDDELAALLAKCEQVRSVGVESFQLLWDDVEHALNCAEDEERYGNEERPSAAAQSELSNRFAAEVEQPGPLVICPMGYAGTGDSAYRRVMKRLLDPGIAVYWTGPEVVSLAIAREELDAAVDRFGDHDLVIWDNYPVNDFDGTALFLGPLRGRDPRLTGGRCAGFVANAMVQAVPSKLALATVADWLRDPGGYDPVASFERALIAYGAEVRGALTLLVPTWHKHTALDQPANVAGLAERLALGVDVHTALALLEPFV
jgi:hyaluronoglucosaminidase